MISAVSQCKVRSIMVLQKVGALTAARDAAAFWIVADAEVSLSCSRVMPEPRLRHCRSAQWPAWAGQGRTQLQCMYVYIYIYLYVWSDARQEGALFALAQLSSSILTTMKSDLGLVKVPSRGEKGLMVHVFFRSQADASSQTSHESDCDEETSNATQKEKDLDADVAKHSFKLQAVAARPIIFDGEFSALQSKLSAVKEAVSDGHYACS